MVMAKGTLKYLDKSTGLGMLHCEECMHSQREVTCSTVLLRARLFQDRFIGQLWCNNSSALPEKKRVGRSSSSSSSSFFFFLGGNTVQCEYSPP